MKKLIIALFLALLISGCHRGEPEIIVVPKGFKGYILIIFNQAKGSSPKYEDGKRVYEIPSNGILKTQFAANYGWRELAEYYFNRITSENKLPSFVDLRKVPKNRIVGFMGSNGNANKDLAGKETVEFCFFYIGTKSEIEHYQGEANKLDIVRLAEDN